MNTNDPHDQRKEAIEDQMRDDREAKDELRRKLCAAIGWQETGLVPLDSNLITKAKEKLLTADELRIEYVHCLAACQPEYLPTKSSLTKFEWALTQSTEVQQARAILEAVK